MKIIPCFLFAAAVSLGGAISAQAALVAGDVAIIGWADNGTPDNFTFVTLAPVGAGEDIYFTDNGWTGAQYRPGSGGVGDGDGSEGLIKWTAAAAIPAGRIINSLDSGGDFFWTRTGVGGIPGVPPPNTGQFTDLSLGDPNEQIYAFQATTNNPLFNPTAHLFVLDDTNGFENATTGETGSIPPGLSLGQTAITFPFAAARFIAFNTASLSSGTKSEWLGAIANSSNWQTGTTGTQPSGTINVVPEPTAAVALLAGLGVLMGRRRRRV